MWLTRNVADKLLLPQESLEEVNRIQGLLEEDDGASEPSDDEEMKSIEREAKSRTADLEGREFNAANPHPDSLLGQKKMAMSELKSAVAWLERVDGMSRWFADLPEMLMSMPERGVEGMKRVSRKIVEGACKKRERGGGKEE